MKQAAASVKEKAANLGSKIDAKKEEKKIGAKEDVGKAMAHDKGEKQQVKADAHAQEAQVLREKEAAKGTHAAEKDAAKATEVHRKEAAKDAYNNPAL